MNNNRKWRQENRETINEKANERFRTDTNARLKKNYRTRIYKLLKGTNCSKSLSIIDCSMSFLKEWLESNFKDGMTMENYGPYWHVDHVIPCSLFDMTNDDEVKVCFHWSNLQPLEASINESKHNNIDQNEVIEHYKKVKIFATKHNIKLNDFDFTKYF